VVILAAGRSARMACPKLLLDWGGRPIICHVAEIARKAGLSDIVVVTGAYHDELSAVLSGEQVNLVYNSGWAEGEMLSSVQIGLKSLPPGVSGAMVMLGDHPGVSVGTVRRLVSAFAEADKPIVIPEYRGRSGHPIIIHRLLWGEVFRLDVSVGLRQLMRRHTGEILRVSVFTDEIFRDIDTPDEYRREFSARFGGNGLP